MDFNLFLRRCEEKFPKEKCLTSVVNRFQEVFSDGEYSQMDRACDLFYITNKISKSQFFRIKQYVKELYCWFYEQGIVTKAHLEYIDSLTLDDVISNREVSRFYFRDLNEVLKFISGVGVRCGASDDDLLAVKSVAILSWAGVERSEIVELKKTDLIDSRCAARLEKRESEVELSIEAYLILRRFADINEYKGIPHGKKQTLLDSPYLMRSTRAAKLNENMLSQIFKRFNSVSDDFFEQKLSIKSLQNNGVFYKMALEEGEKNLYDLVAEVVGCDRSAAVWYKTIFEKWKSVYYAEEEIRREVPVE